MRISDWSSDVCSSDLILLVILLGVIEGRRVEDFGGDLAPPGRCQGRLVQVARAFGGLTLGRRSDVDARTVLGADVVALAHALGRIMVFPEQDRKSTRLNSSH